MYANRDCEREMSPRSNLNKGLRRLLRKAWKMLAVFAMKAVDVSGSGRINL